MASKHHFYPNMTRDPNKIAKLCQCSMASKLHFYGTLWKAA